MNVIPFRTRTMLPRTLTAAELAIVEVIVGRRARMDAMARSDAPSRVSWDIDTLADEAIASALHDALGVDIRSFDGNQFDDCYATYLIHFYDTRREMARRRSA